MTMIASVLHLDRKAVKALRITDVYSLHRIVYSLYEDIRTSNQKQASATSGILYADQGGDFKSRKILMLSNRQPSTMVENQYGYVNSKPIPDDFLAHDEYRFQVIVNPTRRENASRKLVPLRGREAVGEWFLERSLASWGFETIPKHLQVEAIEVLRFRDKEQRPVTIAQAHIEGVLRVTDRSQFVASFEQGVGRARAYGCGLLQIVPVIPNPFN